MNEDHALTLVVKQNHLISSGSDNDMMVLECIDGEKLPTTDLGSDFTAVSTNLNNRKCIFSWQIQRLGLLGIQLVKIRFKLRVNVTHSVVGLGLHSVIGLVLHSVICSV